MELTGSIPMFIRLTESYIHDSKVMNEIPFMANAYYLMDKGYVKFDSLYKHFHQNHAWFVTRAKDNMLYVVTESREVDTQTGLISDDTIQLTGFYTSQKYPDIRDFYNKPDEPVNVPEDDSNRQLTLW